MNWSIIVWLQSSINKISKEEDMLRETLVSGLAFLSLEKLEKKQIERDEMGMGIGGWKRGGYFIKREKYRKRSELGDWKMRY